MFIAHPFPEDLDAQKIGEKYFSPESSASHEELLLWGKIWLREGKVILGFPSHPIDQFNPPPVAFIDETIQQNQNLFFIGAIIFKPILIIIAAGRHIQNLLVLREKYPHFWKADASPPRIHLREQTHPKSKNKTKWASVAKNDIELLFKTVIPAIKQYAGLKIFAPVHLNELKRVAKGFPSVTEIQIDQLSLQFSALMFKVMIAEKQLISDQLELITDHNHTPIYVGKKRRQATLHFLDCVLKSSPLDIPNFSPAILKLPNFVLDGNARYSSKFPDDFTIEKLEGEGYCLRKLCECVGLQFIDLYLGLWKMVNAQKKPVFGISSDDLGEITITNMHWAKTQ